MSDIPDIRIRCVNESEVDPSGDYVLYWMIAFRRGCYNYSLQRAVEWAKRLNKPLFILEALRSNYPWASDRIHQFVAEGMWDNAVHFAKKDVLYYPYLEPKHGAGKGLLKELAHRACVVISDDFPCFFLPKMIRAAASQIRTRFELIDSNGLLPMRAAPKVFLRAVDFRRFLQKNLLPHLAEIPKADPLLRTSLPLFESLPSEIKQRWPSADLNKLLERKQPWTSFPIDHNVPAVTTIGGSKAAKETLRAFLKRKLPLYDEDRNQPEKDMSSGLSPYLHFGHLSSHEFFESLMKSIEWTPDQVANKATGSSSGWWGASTDAEAILDQFITWRELGYNMCWQREDYEQYDSLPAWAQKTLDEHAADTRSHIYSLAQFEEAKTHDPLWNAAQNQLVREGRMHNYLRMLWGKKILEWTAKPHDALDIMIELNNKYALDGRNPNSYSGIFWVLGRYDRAWGPERPIFGKIRYMSSENTARKVKVKNYIEKYSQ